MGRARRESARLNGKTRASGISSFVSFFHPPPPLSSFSSLSYQPSVSHFLLSRVKLMTMMDEDEYRDIRDEIGY